MLTSLQQGKFKALDENKKRYFQLLLSLKKNQFFLQYGSDYDYDNTFLAN